MLNLGHNDCDRMGFVDLMQFARMMAIPNAAAYKDSGHGLERGGHDDLVWRLQTELGGGLWRWRSFSDV